MERFCVAVNFSTFFKNKIVIVLISIIVKINIIIVNDLNLCEMSAVRIFTQENVLCRISVISLHSKTHVLYKIKKVLFT